MEVERKRRLLMDVNPHLLCVLCAGYYVEPTTIVECLHSFCRSCIIKYLETSKFCPICDVQLHKTKPLLSIRRDIVLERIVYKIVPGLYANEMKRRGLPLEEVYLTPDDSISLVLQYHVEDAGSQKPDDEENHNESNQDLKVYRKYLRCPAAVTVEHLKKFLILKYSLTDQHQVEILHSSEILPNDITLMDIAYCFEWKMTSPLELLFQILEKSTVAVPIAEEVESVEDVDVDDEDSRSVASSSLPFMSSKSISECDDASNTSLDSKPLIERLESEMISQKRKRNRETLDDEPERKKSLFDSLLLSASNNSINNNNNNNNNETESRDFQESDDDYSKYEQDIEEIIEVEDDDDDSGRLRISSNVSDDDVNNDETTSQMFVIGEAAAEEPAAEEELSRYGKASKEKHWKSEGRNKRKSKKGKHHHHHKRRVSQSPPPTATIVHSPDRDIMKLKVKLNTLPGYRHSNKDDHKHHHKHAKQNNGSASSAASSIVSSPSRSSYKEDDSVLSEQSCDSVQVALSNKRSREEVARPQTERLQPAAAVGGGDARKSHTRPRSSQSAACESPRSDASSAKESSSQRSARSKPKPAFEQQANAAAAAAAAADATPHKMIIMPPSSITVSIITAEEKLKMEKDKTLMLTGNHDFENKRPSLEIVRVNGPPSALPANAEAPKASPKLPKELPHEERPPPSPSPRPKTKKPVPAVIPIKSAKPSITIIPQNNGPVGNHSNNNNNHNGGVVRHEEQKSSVTISLENGCQNDSALDLSGKSSRKDGCGQQYSASNNINNSNNNANKCGASSSPHANGGQYESPSMRNLMTLSDTAVHIRNMMSPSSSAAGSGPGREQPHDAKKRFGNHNGGGHVVGNGSCSPKRHNGIVPLRIPVPPASGSFGKAAGPAQNNNNNHNNNNNNNNNNNKPAKVAATTALRASDAKPKHGPPNQGVRHIPNPSVLLFRHHQQHLAQLAASAAAAAGNGKRPSPPSSSAAAAAIASSRMPQLPMAGTIPLHTIRKMENMTKNIEKVAAGLSVKANALYKQNFIENGRARLELPS